MDTSSRSPSGWDEFERAPGERTRIGNCAERARASRRVGLSERERVEGWLLSNVDLIARDTPVLDLASGRGRHALMLASRGWEVHAIDRDAGALTSLDDQARRLGRTVRTRCLDLEREAVDLGTDRWGTILVFNYLHRPLFPVIVRALAPGGVLIYQTFTIGQRARGRPRNPAFLLQPGELPRLVAPLVVLRSREGDFDGKLVASVAARKHLP